MHNLHLVVLKADNAQDACDTVETEIQDFGNENNWRTICGCVSEDNKILDLTDKFSGRWSPKEKGYNTIADLNKLVMGWMKNNFYGKPALEKLNKEAKKGKMNVTKWDTQSLWALQRFAEHQYQVNTVKAVRKQRGEKKVNSFDITKDSFFGYSYTECGVTQLDHMEGKKLFVVLIDMHD